MHFGQRWIFYSSCLKGEAFPVVFSLFLEHLQILPMGNVRHFRRIRKNDTLFQKMCAVCGKLVNYLENLQILPLGNVRLFRIIRKNATFLSENVRCLWKFSEFFGKYTNSTLGKRASFL